MGPERRNGYDVDRRERFWRLGLSICAALIVHLAIWQVLSFQHNIDLQTDRADYITVKLINEAKDAPNTKQPDRVIAPKPVIKPAPAPLAKADKSPETNLPQMPEFDIADAPPFAETMPELSINTPNINTPSANGLAIDERFLLKNWNGPVDEDFKALITATDCFGFDVKCAAQRKSLFASLQATDEQRALEQRAPHVGLPAEFYGLSEREIRKKLNVPFAGENGQVIIPFVLTIDGPIWDALHGVNKHCEHKFAGNGREGPKLIRDCGRYRRADPKAFERFEQQRDGEYVPYQNYLDKDDVK